MATFKTLKRSEHLFHHIQELQTFKIIYFWPMYVYANSAGNGASDATSPRNNLFRD